MKSTKKIPQNTGNSCDVLLLFVNDNERDAVFNAAKECKLQPEINGEGTMTYHDFGAVNGVRVMCLQTRMGAIGRGAAGPATLTAIHELNPDYIIAVGIAFGMDKEKQRIGDILVSETVATYEAEKIESRKIFFIRRETRIKRGDIASAPEKLSGKIRAASAPAYWSGAKAKIHFGQILSGEKLIDCADFKQNLQDYYPEAIGGEMEAAGIYASAELKKKDWIIVKAVCDHADGNKGDNKEANQKLAAANAASFVFHSLKCGVFSKTQFREQSPPYDDNTVQDVETEEPTQRSQVPDPGVAARVREQIRKLLEEKHLKPLREALVGRLKANDAIVHENSVTPEQTLVDIDVFEAVYMLDRAVHDSIHFLKTNGSKTEEILLIWNGSVDILGWLMLLSVDYDFYGLPPERPGGKSLGMKLEIPVETEAGIEIVFSGYVNSPAKLTVNEAKNKVYGKNSIRCPRGETGWEEDDFVQSIKKDLWKKIFKGDDPGFIDKNKTKTLNTRIGIQNRNKENIYITVSGDDLKSPLRKNDVLAILKRELSALHTVIITIDSVGDSDTVFIVSEPELEGYLLEFYQNKPE